MEDEPTAPLAPEPPTEAERTEAEDTSPQDAPAEPEDDPDGDGGAGEPGDAQPDGAEPTPTPVVAHEIPRTTTTGDERQDLRDVGDGADTGPPGDDLDDAAQRHD